MDGFLGVIGGMGPLATADFLGKLVVNCPAQTDQEHLPVILYGDCTTPDRTENILGKGPSPLPKLLAGIAFLNRAGVKAICIPCNSAHCWYDEMAAASEVPVLHIVRVSAAQVKKKNPQAKVVGVLSTFGTHQMGIYRKTLDQRYEVVTPTDEEFDKFVSPGIAMIKANQLDAAESLFQRATERLVARGAEVVVLGCTEIPIGMRKQYHLNPELFIDSNDALALSAIEFLARNGGPGTLARTTTAPITGGYGTPRGTTDEQSGGVAAGGRNNAGGGTNRGGGGGGGAPLSNQKEPRSHLSKPGDTDHIEL